MPCSAVPEVPTPPFIAPAPNPGSWSITVKQKTPPPPPAKATDPIQVRYQELLRKVHPRMVTQTVQQTGGDWRSETTWESGSNDVLWDYRGITLFQSQNFPSGKLLVAPVGSQGVPHKPDSDFPDVSWVDAKNFVRIEQAEGVTCYLYQTTAQALSKSKMPAGGDAPVSAWIDKKTRLPVAMENDAVRKTFSFDSPPASLQPEGIFADYYRRFAPSLNASAPRPALP